MKMSDQPSDRTSQYRIVSILGGWRIQHDGATLGPFADPAEAIERACDAAKEDAARGRVAIVTADTTPQELHCYSPVLESQQPYTPASGGPAYPRLVASR